MSTKQPDKELKKFAINERGELGFIMEVQIIGKTKVYLGIPVADVPSWISLKPAIVKDTPAINSILEISLHLRPDTNKGTGAGDKINSNAIFSGSFNLNTGLMTAENLNDASSTGPNIFQAHPHMTVKDLFSQLFNEGLPTNINNSAMPKASDFNLEDKEDEQTDDGC